MRSLRTLYGIVSVLVALLVMSGSVAAFYYSQYQQDARLKDEFVRQLQEAEERYSETADDYNSLASRYNGILSDYGRLVGEYNKTVDLLVRSIAVLNTSLPVYHEASRLVHHFWDVYLEVEPAPTSLVRASVLIDFGNDTSRWYNNTRILPGWNLYEVTLILTKGEMEAQWFPQYGSHFVTGIGGVRNSESAFWFFWTYDEDSSWQVAPVGSDQITVLDGSVYAWTYCGIDQSFSPTCRP